jgi:hypothetical protein
MARCLHPPLRIPNPDWQDVEKGPPALFSQRVEAHRTATGKSLSRQARGGRVRMNTLRPQELPAHRLACVRKRDVHYSSRRGPGCGRTAERRVSARRVGRVRTTAILNILRGFFMTTQNRAIGFQGPPSCFSTAC